MATASWRGAWRPDLVKSRTVSESHLNDLPASRLAVTYLLLVPMIIFAVHGGFSFEHRSWNSDLGAFGGRIAIASTPAETLRETVQSYVALALCLAVMAPHYRQVLRNASQMSWLLLLPLYATSSALWSQDPGRSFRSGLSLLVTTLFALHFAARFSRRQQMEIVLFTGVCVAVASAALALFWPQFGVDHQLHEGAWQGLFTQKNVCAEATLFLLTPALAASSPGRYGQLLRGVYIGLCLLIILMTQSRTGWAVTLVYLAFTRCLRILGRFERRDLLPLMGVLFALLAAALTAVVGERFQFLNLVSRSESFSGRSQIWSAVVSSILRQPIGGYGFDAFWSLLHGEAARVFSAAGWVVTSAHNGFLNVGLELGLVGLVLVAATLIQAFRNASAAFHPGRSNYVDWCIGIVFLTIATNLDERTIMATQYLPWVLYIVACAGLKEAARNASRHLGWKTLKKEIR